ncbi:unnamed protein product [Durusdinium trenchii]|uniref:Uncharacterized protein n=2 Tax=Durusdinium trenchii TaxID=1381693 RepID=A0ABP0NB67_9DINO
MLAALAMVLGANYVVEQPSSSTLVFWPHIQYLCSLHTTLFKRFWMSTFNHWTAKPSYLFGSAPWLDQIESKRVCKVGSGQGMVKKAISKSGRKTVAGGPSMRSSAAYPEAFTEFVMAKHYVNPDPPSIQLPEDLTDLQPPQPLFQWEHADLEPLRAFLLQAVKEGKFNPQPNLPL